MGRMLEKRSLTLSILLPGEDRKTIDLNVQPLKVENGAEQRSRDHIWFVISGTNELGFFTVCEMHGMLKKVVICDGDRKIPRTYV